MKPLVPLIALLTLAAPAAHAASSGMQSGAAGPTTAQADPMAFVRGAQAWAQNCGRCHVMRDPNEYTDRQWAVISTHMRLRAGLDGRQVRDITLFLQGSN